MHMFFYRATSYSEVKKKFSFKIRKRTDSHLIMMFQGTFINEAKKETLIIRKEIYFGKITRKKWFERMLNSLS